jgi:predicted GNAT superfamily acetyltransferase
MTLGPPLSQIEIRDCTTLEEYEECVRVEHITWGPELAEPTGMFAVAHHTGGQVFAAFDGAKMVGFTLAVAGTRAGKTFLHSHQTAVLPEYRDRGVGRRLKLFQREDALRRGINLVEWTFDPLELRNAHFNLVRLGAVARRLIPNCYGITKSPLHSGLPTDRLVAEWWLESARVKAILENAPLPGKGAAERVPLPANIAEIKAQDPEEAIRVQTGLRGRLLRAFAEGHVATSVEARVARTDYILEPAGQIAGLYLSELRTRER